MADATRSIPTTDLDPYSVESILEPYPLQAGLRELGPISWLQRYGTFAVARYADVNAILLDPARFLSSGGVGLSDIRKADSWRPSGPIAEVDPPAHTAVRRTMSRIFNPRTIRSLKDGFREFAVSCCERAAALKEIDAVKEIEPYVLNAFSRALGVELHHEYLIVVGNHSFNLSGPRNELFYESLSRFEQAAQWFEQNQQGAAMRAGGLGEQVFAAEARGELPSGSASPMLRTLIRGGMDTTISALGTTLRLLAESPQWPADTKIQVSLGAANRDPARFDEPGRFNPGRRGATAVGFGMGPHHCLGQAVSKLEAECFLSAMLDRFITFAGPPQYRRLNVLRTLDRLPLRLN